MFTKLSEIVPKYFKKHNLTTVSKAAQVVDLFSKVVREILGENLEKEIKAISLTEDILNLEASSNAAAQEVQMSKLTIIEKLNQSFKEKRVKDFRFKISQNKT